MNKLPSKISNLILIFIILISISSIILSVLMTSFYYEHTLLETNTIDLLKKANGPFMLLESPSLTSYAKAYYSYAAIYYNLSTPSGWSPSELVDERQNLLIKIGSKFHDKKCDEFINTAQKINLKEVITYNEYCQLNCNFKEKIIKGDACLLII